MHSEVYAECQGCAAMRKFYVLHGVPQCVDCGWRSEETPAPIPATCPGCAEPDTLAQTAAPTTASHKILARSAWYTCACCGWHGSAEQASMQPHVHRDVVEMLRDDARKGSKGGGSRSKSYGKDDKLGRVVKLSKQQWEDDAIISRRIETLNPKNEYLRVSGLDAPAEEVNEALRDLIASEGLGAAIDSLPAGDSIIVRNADVEAEWTAE